MVVIIVVIVVGRLDATVPADDDYDDEYDNDFATQPAVTHWNSFAVVFIGRSMVAGGPMALHICILGIDGSGKSTITATLPALLAAELELTAASAGEYFQLAAPDEDHLAKDFEPGGLSFTARWARRLKRWAKRSVNNRKLYPFLKVSQMLFQDAAAWKLGRRAACVVSDGNSLLSTMGRAGNYRRPASDGVPLPAPDAADLAAAFRFLLRGETIPDERRSRLPRLEKGRSLYRIFNAIGFRSIWLPDIVVFLDLSPEEAVKRIAARGQPVDRHENAADLAQAREMYLKTLDAYRLYKPEGLAITVAVDGRSPGEVLRAVVEEVRERLLERHRTESAGNRPLGTTSAKLSGLSFWRKVLNYRYLVRYLIGRFFQGAWREPLFVASPQGRLFLREGYSAGVMRVIYDRDDQRAGCFERVFLNYPLHRAVYDRLQILTKSIEPELATRLQSQEKVRIFTAPSGFAYDLFRPLEKILAAHPECAGKVQFTAADLDPHGVLKSELEARAAKLGIAFTFLRGDLTKAEFQEQCAAGGPYDVALFVGLSSWFPKPATVRHLEWLRAHLRDDGLLVTDCFTPAAYAYSGRYIGYKAHYYEPATYRMILDRCGFDGLHAPVTSGRDGINHVVLARVRTGRMGFGV